MTPIYEQIVEQVKTLIRNEKLKENDNLQMCIIDRFLSSRLIHRSVCARLLARIAIYLEGSAVINMCPVSYTHLDVYKRQAPDTSS